MRGGADIKNAIRRWLPALAWMAIIFYVSSRHNPPGPADPWLDFVWKKGVHFASYALLAYLFERALAWPRHGTAVALGLTVLYAISDEFHQSFVPGRTARATDVLIDAAGACFSLYALRLLRRFTGGTTRSLRDRPDQADDESSV